MCHFFSWSKENFGLSCLAQSWLSLIWHPPLPTGIPLFQYNCHPSQSHPQSISMSANVYLHRPCNKCVRYHVNPCHFQQESKHLHLFPLQLHYGRHPSITNYFCHSMPPTVHFLLYTLHSFEHSTTSIYKHPLLLLQLIATAPVQLPPSDSCTFRDLLQLMYILFFLCTPPSLQDNPAP